MFRPEDPPMTTPRPLALLGLCAALGMIAPAAAQTLTEADVKRLALEAILENPEIVLEAVQILQDRDAEAQARAAAAMIAEMRDVLSRDPNAPVLGNPDGDVTMVEFFDYNCSYCKRAFEDVKTLLEADGNIRFVSREWPILGEGSVAAARAALAAREQGRYEDMHNALMSDRSRKDEAAVLRIAEGLGLDVERLRADMTSDAVNDHIALSMQLAEALGFNGTPAFVIGDEPVPGAVPLAALQQAVAEARAAN
jgi:protein-disulfide isomerase